jgi:excisionase family DNA binding protein
VTELKVRARAATIALERLLAEPMGEFDLTHSPPPDAAEIIQPETKPPRPALGDPKRWITVDEAASFFGCSRRTIEKLLHRHAIPTLRIGRLVRIDLPGAQEALLKTRLGA